MSVERRSDANRETWRVRWREGGKARARNFRTYDAAIAFEADRLRRRDLGAFAPVIASERTVGEWLAEWQGRYGSGWAETTRRQRRWILARHVLGAVGHVPLKDMGPARVREFHDALTRQGSARTVNAVMSVMSAALGKAVEEGLIPSNPTAGIRALPAFRVRPRALSVREVEALRAAMTCDRDRLIVALLAYAGMRPAEVVALPWANVSPFSIIVDRSAQYGQLVPTKTRRIRTVRVEDALREDVDRARQRARGALVVPAERGGLLVWRNFVRRQWQQACRVSGVSAVPYDLRHTFATAMIYAGRPIHEVSAALGHASASMTLDTYAHALEDTRLSGVRDFNAEAHAERVRVNAVLTPDPHGGQQPGAYVAAQGDGMHAEHGGSRVHGQVRGQGHRATA